MPCMHSALLNYSKPSHWSLRGPAVFLILTDNGLIHPRDSSSPQRSAPAQTCLFPSNRSLNLTPQLASSRRKRTG